MTCATDQLTLFEREELDHHEAVIAHGLKTFVDVGQSLMFIRDRKLYRAEYKTFADYCRKRWDIGSRRGYQLIDAAKVYENVNHGSQNDDGETTAPMPSSERQARPLGKLPADEQADAWQEAVDKSTGKPTAADVSEVVKNRLSTPAEADQPAHTPLAQHRTGTDEWYTPQKYLDAAREVLDGIFLDPASSAAANKRVMASQFFTADHDGLGLGWLAPSVWLNPPYSNTGEWVAKWHEAVQAGSVTEAILLVFANTDTNWFQPLWKHWMCFTDHRIKFERPDGSTGNAPPKGSVFAYSGPESKKFAKVFSQFGQIVPPVWDDGEERNARFTP